MIFRASLFIKKPCNIFLPTFIMFELVKVGKFIEHMCQKLSKTMLIEKFHRRMKYLPIFFSFFHPRIKFDPCLLDSDEFIPG